MPDKKHHKLKKCSQSSSRCSNRSMTSFKVPNQVLQYLTCQSCLNFLSCGPITVISNGRSLCGRCRSGGSYSTKSQLFVDVARYFKFPCMYWREHCPALLRWDDVVSHEKSCTYGNKCSTFFVKPAVIFKSKKTMDLSERIRLLEIPEGILPKLTCSLCQNYLSCPPIHVNQDGQQICHRCCATKDLNGYVRHIALETLLQIVVFPCIYRNWGCPISDKFGETCNNHEQDCSYGQSYKKVPYKKTSYTKDGKLKEKGLVESHRGPVWATITPNTIPFGQGKVKLTSQLQYNNTYMEPHMQLVMDPSMLMEITSRSNDSNSTKDEYDQISLQSTDPDARQVRKKSDKSNYSGKGKAPRPPVHMSRQTSEMSKVSSSASLQTLNVNQQIDREPPTPPPNQQYFDNLQHMYLNHGHPGYLPGSTLALNRSGSFAESSIKPVKNLGRNGSNVGAQYDGILHELKLRQKLTETIEVDRY